MKALPKMAKAARSMQLQRLIAHHLEETETQVERLNESLKLLGAPARAKPCKGMAGLVEEGEEVMDEGKKKDDAPADLALIGAAQRVEHYEIAAYTTAQESRAAASHAGHRGAADACRSARSKTPVSCSIRSRSPSCRLLECRHPSSELSFDLMQLGGPELKRSVPRKLSSSAPSVF